MNTITQRLNKINGQISGLVKMIEENQDCEKILIQFKACKAALNSAYAVALQSSLNSCLKDKDNKKRDKIMRWLVEE